MPAEIQVRGLDHFHQRMEPSQNGDIGFGVNVVSWDGTRSFQAIWADFAPAATFGSSTNATPAYGAAVMGNITGSAAVAGTDNILAGVIGKWDLTGTISATYAGAAVRGEIGNNSTSARAAILAVMGGDTATSSAVAAFGVDWNASTVASKFDYGMDLEGLTAHDSYLIPRYDDGFIRMGGRVLNAAGVEVTITNLVILAGTAAPTDGTSGTGLNNAGPGSLYIRQSGSDSKIYINGNTAASPTWNLVTSA